MPEDGTQEVVYLPVADGNWIELAVDRPREPWPSCQDMLGRGGPAGLAEVEGGFRTGQPSERVVDFVVGR
ncbi:MAG TPA: hypothetical protein VGL51_17775 [Solirubrobacteraceae bacterium]|jgi:hypothetical protein